MWYPAACVYPVMIRPLVVTRHPAACSYSYSSCLGLKPEASRVSRNSANVRRREEAYTPQPGGAGGTGGRQTDSEGSSGSQYRGGDTGTGAGSAQDPPPSPMTLEEIIAWISASESRVDLADIGIACFNRLQAMD